MVSDLFKNWGEPAQNLTCNCEWRYHDPEGPWECYVMALDPEAPDQAHVIINGETIEVGIINLVDIMQMYNVHGEPPSIDADWRPRNAAWVLKQLTERKNASANTN